MDILLKIIGRIAFFFALIAHFILITLFFAPTLFLISVAYGDIKMVSEEQIPEVMTDFLIENPVLNFSMLDKNQNVFKQLIFEILDLRRNHFMDIGEQIALDLTILDFGQEVVGMEAASNYYFNKPLAKISEEEWKMLINFHTIFSS